MRRVLLAFFASAVLSSATALDSGSLAVTPQPGTHPGPVSVQVTTSEGSTLRYRFLETPMTRTFPWTGPLVLGALPGESRTYTLRLSMETPSGEATTRDFRYVVVGPVVPWPSVTPSPGVYPSAVKVDAVLPPGWTATESGKPAATPLVLDTPPGTRRSFLVAVQGPKDEAVAWSYAVDRRDQEELALDVVSPIGGTWANAQPLVVTFRGLDRVLWCYGDHFDLAAAQEYDGPELLAKPGPQTVTVAGRARADGRWIEKTVTWTNGNAGPPTAGWPASGYQPTGIALPEAAGWAVSWDEGHSWQPSRATPREAPSAVSRKVLSVLARADGAVSRYVYWLDSRPPQAPKLEFVGGWNPQVLFSGSAEAFHRVVWTMADGKTRDEPLGLWGPWGAWKVPDGAVAAWVGARGPNGTGAPTVNISFAEAGWAVPSWEPWDQKGTLTDPDRLPFGGRVLPRVGFRPVYEVSDRPDVPEPGPGSPVLDGAFLPSVPWGADRTFYVRFAWRDAAGLTGPASGVQTVRVDRVPPSAPEVLEVPGQVIVKPAEGEEEGITLAWAVTTERVVGTDSLTFQPYRTALPAETLRAGTPGKLWFHAQAQDRSGNTGPARLNVALSLPSASDSAAPVVQVDPDPMVGDTPVESGGVYPWPQFRLRPLGQGQDLWVGVTDQGTAVPTDWKARLQPWSGVLSRAVARGERRTFLVYWNAKTADGWSWTEPRTLVLTLDQGPPAPVTVSKPWPQAPLGTAWSLDLRPGRVGDSLRYSYTLDGSLPADPLKAGQVWPGTQTWDAPALGRVAVRLRVSAVSVSGLAVEVPSIPTVVIDRSGPPAVVPSLAPFTYRTEPLTVALPPGAPLVRFSLTSDGGTPAAPGAESPPVPVSGLVLPGVPRQSVLYRFRWRPYSEAGLPGPVGDTYSVLVDRTAVPVVPEASGPGPAAGGPVPLVSGYPASGVSAQPVVLKAEWPAGILRYEVREGLGAPRSVTSQSPAFDGPLVLDGGPGIDRSFAVSVRGFTAEGTPLTDEVRREVRVDRSPPSTPEFTLVPDPRRPEATIRTPGEGHNPEEVLTYRWSWESYPQGEGQTDWKPWTGESPVFVSPRGALSRLKVQAYLVDEAGNQGPVAEKTLLVDQNVVYVAGDATQGDGTRDKPLASVAEAVDKMHREGKGILLVAQGTYPLTRSLDLGGIAVSGGWASDLWETSPNPGHSLWTAQSPFTGDTVLESGDRDWSLTRIDLTVAPGTADRVVTVRGAAATVRSSTWNWAGAAVGWDQGGGTLDWSDVTVAYQAEPRGRFLSLEDGEATIQGLNLSAVQNQGGVLFSQNASSVLVRNLAVVSKKASGYDGVWSATGGKLTLNNARILAGDGASRSVGFILKDTESLLWNTEANFFGSASNTGFQVTGGRLELQKTTVNLVRGDEFNQALVMETAEAVLRACLLKVESGAYQGGLTMDRGSLDLSGGKVQLAGGGQRVWGAQFTGVCLVKVEDMVWTLGKPTPGDLWKIQKPWAAGSSVTDSTSTGW